MLEKEKEARNEKLSKTQKKSLPLGMIALRTGEASHHPVLLSGPCLTAKHKLAQVLQEPGDQSCQGRDLRSSSASPSQAASWVSKEQASGAEAPVTN